MNPDHQLLDDDIRCPECGSLEVCDCEGHPMTPTNTPEAARLAEERQRFEAACKLHGWTPGDFMLGAYAGWLAAKQDAAPTSASTVPEWLPIETAPKDGYILCFEDGAMRLKLRHDGQWIEADYPFIRVVGPGWEDHVVGNEAKRMTGGYSLGVAEGCPNPTHWMPLPNPPGACSVTDGEAKK